MARGVEQNPVLKLLCLAGARWGAALSICPSVCVVSLPGARSRQWLWGRGNRAGWPRHRVRDLGLTMLCLPGSTAPGGAGGGVGRRVSLRGTVLALWAEEGCWGLSDHRPDLSAPRWICLTAQVGQMIFAPSESAGAFAPLSRSY